MSIDSAAGATMQSLSLEQAAPLIQSGDIMLCSGSALFSTLIKNATNSQWSHVGLVFRLAELGQLMVLESVETIGVRAVPLSSYISNYNGSGKGYDGKILIARHQQFKSDYIVALAEKAVSLLGDPYNTDDIIRIAARVGMKGFGFTSGSNEIQPQREFICSEYVYTCFKSVGIAIPYDPMGFIAPADIADCPDVMPITCLI